MRTSSPRHRSDRDEPPKAVLTVDEAVPILRLSRNTIYELAKAGKIPTLHGIGRRVLIPRAALERYLATAGERVA